jgi:hypothetical protein
LLGRFDHKGKIKGRRSMPCISQFQGVDIYMYYSDHPPPHFHAFHGDDEALVEWTPPQVYE